jgi:hypothetical protein
MFDCAALLGMQVWHHAKLFKTIDDRILSGGNAAQHFGLLKLGEGGVVSRNPVFLLIAFRHDGDYRRFVTVRVRFDFGVVLIASR